MLQRPEGLPPSLLIFVTSPKLMIVLLWFVIAAFSVWVLYWAVFFIGVSSPRHAPAARSSTPEPHGVSVLVCAHDDEMNLRTLVPLLLQQDYPLYEIIVVEDRCNDGTYDYLLELTAAEPKIKMVRVVVKPDHINGKKFAITLGIKAARFDWVLLTDADCRPGREWVKKMAEGMTPPAQLVLGYSPYQRKNGLLNSFIRFETILTGIQMMGLANTRWPYMGVGRNLAYTRKLFLETKGFNDHLAVTGGDDDLFVNKHARHVRVATVLAPEASVPSVPKDSWLAFLLQKTRHLSAGKHYRVADKVVLGLFQLASFSSLWGGAALLLTPLWAYGLGLLLTRWLLMAGTLLSFEKRTADAPVWWQLPLLDFIYSFYYLVTSLRAVATQKVRWKN